MAELTRALTGPYALTVFFGMLLGVYIVGGMAWNVAGLNSSIAAEWFSKFSIIATGIGLIIGIPYKIANQQNPPIINAIIALFTLLVMPILIWILSEIVWMFITDIGAQWLGETVTLIFQIVVILLVVITAGTPIALIIIDKPITELGGE